jgi:hypothetical protein
VAEGRQDVEPGRPVDHLCGATAGRLVN